LIYFYFCSSFNPHYIPPAGAVQLQSPAVALAWGQLLPGKPMFEHFSPFAHWPVLRQTAPAFFRVGNDDGLLPLHLPLLHTPEQHSPLNEQLVPAIDKAWSCLHPVAAVFFVLQGGWPGLPQPAGGSVQIPLVHLKLPIQLV
tara:strand:+ start:571 stop:996 length:426 start_codon:yes stop_codon:yes gene_type:complete